LKSQGKTRSFSQALFEERIYARMEAEAKLAVVKGLKIAESRIATATKEEIKLVSNRLLHLGDSLTGRLETEIIGYVDAVLRQRLRIIQIKSLHRTSNNNMWESLCPKPKTG